MSVGRLTDVQWTPDGCDGRLTDVRRTSDGRLTDVRRTRLFVFLQCQALAQLDRFPGTLLKRPVSLSLVADGVFILVFFIVVLFPFQLTLAAMGYTGVVSALRSIVARCLKI